MAHRMNVTNTADAAEARLLTNRPTKNHLDSRTRVSDWFGKTLWSLSFRCKRNDSRAANAFNQPMGQTPVSILLNLLEVSCYQLKLDRRAPAIKNQHIHGLSYPQITQISDFMKKLAKIFLLTLSILLVVAIILGARIYSFGNTSYDGPADAAIVLGAAVWSSGVSPVFRERINHGIDLYQRGRVRKLIFSGGQGNPGEPTESSAARDYALQSGVPLQDILIEEKSHTTYENISYAKQLADTHAIKKVLIVSDPLHMKRAVLMAQDAGLIAEPSPTPSTRYQGLKSQLGLLVHETYYYIGYLMRRSF